MSPPILHVLETCLYCDDLAAAESFYVVTLGLQIHSKQSERHLFLRCADSMVLLFLPEHTSSIPSHVNGALIPLHGARGAGHVAFAVDESDLEKWKKHLVSAGVPIESEVRWPTGGQSLYVRDPAGNSVELATPNLWT